jgi:hypothetical protein
LRPASGAQGDCRVKKHGHNEKLNFGGFSGYYGLMSAHDGYGGFNYLDDFYYMNQSTWTKPDGPGYEQGWCDTGYQNVAAAAHATSEAWIYGYGLMESGGRSFTLESFLACAGWSSDMPWNIVSYTDDNGVLKEKASDRITVTFSKAEKINLTTTGPKQGFANIAAVAFTMVSSGQPGNTCIGSVGYGVIGYQIAIDAVKVRFSKRANLKHDNGHLLTPYLLHHQHHGAHAGPLLPGGHHPDAAADSVHDPDGHQGDGSYHTQLLSLEHHSGLTVQFALPQPEHFGT